MTTIICVRGSYTLSQNAFSWYSISFNPNGNHGRNLNQALSSENLLLQFIDAMKEKYQPKK